MKLQLELSRLLLAQCLEPVANSEVDVDLHLVVFQGWIVKLKAEDVGVLHLGSKLRLILCALREDRLRLGRL